MYRARATVSGKDSKLAPNFVKSMLATLSTPYVVPCAAMSGIHANMHGTQRPKFPDSQWNFSSESSRNQNIWIFDPETSIIEQCCRPKKLWWARKRTRHSRPSRYHGSCPWYFLRKLSSRRAQNAGTLPQACHDPTQETRTIAFSRLLKMFVEKCASCIVIQNLALPL